LRNLPRLEACFTSGELGYSRVRELTRVASPDDEAAWIDFARTAGARALERRVASVKGAQPREEQAGSADDGAENQSGRRSVAAPVDTSSRFRVKFLSPDVVQVELDAELWALLERAMEGARHAAGSDEPMSEHEVASARE